MRRNLSTSTRWRTTAPSIWLSFRLELNLEEEAEVVILKIVEEDGEELLASVDDEEESLRLYNLFMSRLERCTTRPEDDEE